MPSSGVQRVKPLLEQEPVIDASRCVHGFCGDASCRECIDACPTQAWILNDTSLDFDSERCDGCGLCGAACPQGAINDDPCSGIYRWADDGSLLLCCQRSGEDGAERNITCLHSLGLSRLLSLYGKGVRHLCYAPCDCGNCDRGAGVHLWDRIRAINGSLRSRGLGTMLCSCLADNHWKEMHSRSKLRSAHQRMSRRGFLRLLKDIDDGEDPGTDKKRGGFLAPGELLGESGSSATWPCVPTIDPDRCNGCDACLQICPQAAITSGRIDGELRYLLRPVRCTGCRLCLDLCDQQAVSLHPWTRQAQAELVLRQEVCTACGVTYHFPEQQQRFADRHCLICRDKNHYSSLFQVLE